MIPLDRAAWRLCAAALAGSILAAVIEAQADLDPVFPAPVLQLTSEPYTAGAGDVTGDGIPDLVLSERGLTSVFEGRGDWTFGPAQEYPGPIIAFPRNVAVRDLNEDGLGDLLIFNWGYNVVVVHYGLPDGSLAPYELHSGGWGDHLATADFDGDGVLDYAVSGLLFGGRVQVLLVDDTGMLISVPAVEFEGEPGGVGAADLDGDGNVDFAVAMPLRSELLLGFGSGDGSFDAMLGSLPIEGAPADVVAHDFDGDGFNDLAVTNLEMGRVELHPGNGDGTFGAPVMVPVGDAPESITGADLDHDGLLDLLVGHQGDELSILLARSDGTFEVESLSGGSNRVALATADFDLDGQAEIAVFELEVKPGFAAATASLQRRTAAGRFGTVRTSLPRIGTSMTTGDFDGDGLADVVVAHEGDDLISVALGTGGGSFGPTQTYAASSPGALDVGDFDGNGTADIVVASSTLPRLELLLGAGDGSFAPGAVLATASLPTDVGVGDFDGVGPLDIAAANPAAGGVTVHLAAGAGAYSPGVLYSVGGSPKEIAIGHLDGGPDLDIALAMKGTKFRVLRGDGEGNFYLYEPFLLPNGGDHVRIADVDGDGINDVLLFSNNPVTILPGVGGTEFAPPLQFGVVGGPNDIVVEDVDLDGLPDLLVSVKSYSTVWLERGRGDFTFEPGEQMFGSTAPGDLAVVDFDGNGLPDLVAQNVGAQFLTSLVNQWDPGETMDGLPKGISLAAGGQQALVIDQGPAHAFDLFLILGTTSGIAPGFTLGGVTLPLNLDFWLLFTLSNFNVPPLATSFGFLDAEGRSSGLSFALPAGLDPGLAGVQFHHAALTIDELTLEASGVTSAVPLRLDP